MSLRPATPRSATFWLLALSIAAAGCKRSEPEAERPVARAPALEQAPAQPAQPAEPPQPAPTLEPAQQTAAPIGPKPGWSKVSLEDTLPLCVFSSYEERSATVAFPKAKKQKLDANAPVVFGIFPPWCVNDACDDRTLLQCWTERDGPTLTVHSRFASHRKDGAACAKDCLQVEAACETPPLEPGQYTVRHGDKSYSLKIPSVLKAPCFDAK